MLDFEFENAIDSDQDLDLLIRWVCQHGICAYAISTDVSFTDLYASVRPREYKTFFMLNSNEHETLAAHKN